MCLNREIWEAASAAARSKCSPRRPPYLIYRSGIDQDSRKLAAAARREYRLHAAEGWSRHVTRGVVERRLAAAAEARMADTSVSEPISEPRTNGVAGDADEDAEEKAKMRPADIDADVREMERRKRVELIMNSRMFREELERIIEVQMRDGGGGPSGLMQQIQDIIGASGAGRNTNFRVDGMAYAKGEKMLRCKVAAVYRLMDLYGWSQGIYNHVTARLNQDQELFLTNPYGMLYHEITASSLVKVDMQGAVVEAGTTNFAVNVAGFMLHAAIHAARPDLKCIVHVHTPAVLAVSSLKCGLLPLCQESVVIGEVSQHPYVGCLADVEQREKLARNLGPVNKVMFLSNHGAVCCGATVEEAFYNTYNTVLACETQVRF
ncbi:hypothetical protein B566_EDAN008523 [Ephemera danica]|nr:hypothetical protein B566_EDAN008523 [Ephemera danica]